MLLKFDFDMGGREWILGLGLMFALAMVMMVISGFKSLSSFFAFLSIFNAFMVWGALLPLWTLVVNLIVLTLILFFQFKSQGASDQ